MEGKNFDRLCNVIVQDRKIEGLSVEFRIDRSTKPSQNTADISIYNLSKETRKHLQAVPGGVVVQLQAGYKGPSPISPSANASLSAIGLEGDTGEPPIIFLGNIRNVTSLREGPDWLTKISSGDGDEQRKTPISFSLGPGTSFQAAVKKIVDGMKVGIGNTAQAILQGKFPEVGSTFMEGIVLHGDSGEDLRRLLQSANLEYSIQNGQIQILPVGGALNTLAVKLTPGTGLVGSPELGAKGTIKFRSLLNAQIYPGRKIQIQSDSVDGFFKVERAVYLGQTRGNDWYVDGEAAPL